MVLILKRIYGWTVALLFLAFIMFVVVSMVSVPGLILQAFLIYLGANHFITEVSYYVGMWIGVFVIFYHEECFNYIRNKARPNDKHP